MKPIKILLCFLFVFNFSIVSSASDSLNATKHLIKISPINILSYRIHYEYSYRNDFSLGLNAVYSPGGYHGNFQDAKWYSLVPNIRAYALANEPLRLYFEISLPVTYFKNDNFWYKSQEKHSSGGFFGSNNEFVYENINQSYFAFGGGMAIGGQLIFKRISLDAGIGYEHYKVPNKIEKEMNLPLYGSGPIANFNLDPLWGDYLSMRLLLGYQIFK